MTKDQLNEKNAEAALDDIRDLCKTFSGTSGDLCYEIIGILKYWRVATYYAEKAGVSEKTLTSFYSRQTRNCGTFLLDALLGAIGLEVRVVMTGV